MYWEGREALEHREANDRYFGAAELDDEIPFVRALNEAEEAELGYDDGLADRYEPGFGHHYEDGWERGRIAREARQQDEANDNGPSTS